MGSSSFGGGGSLDNVGGSVAPHLPGETQKSPAQIFKLGTFFRVTFTLGLGQKLGCPKKIIIPRGHCGPAMSFYAYNNRAMQHFRDRSGNCEKSWPNPTAVDSLIRCDVHNFQR